MQIIQHQELGSDQTSITFSSIPQTMTDLYCVFSFRMATTNTDIDIDLNGDTNKVNYTSKRLGGSGSSAFSDSTKYYYISNSSAYTASAFGNGSLYLPNYTSSTAKSYSIDFMQETNGTTAYSLIAAALWSGTGAVTSLTFRGNASQNFVQYSSVTLYGITKGSDGIVTVS